MKNSLNGWERFKKGLIDYLYFPVAILGLPFFIIRDSTWGKENREKRRYTKKRRADLVKRFT